MCRIPLVQRMCTHTHSTGWLLRAVFRFIAQRATLSIATAREHSHMFGVVGSSRAVRVDSIFGANLCREHRVDMVSAFTVLINADDAIRAVVSKFTCFFVATIASISRQKSRRALESNPIKHHYVADPIHTTQMPQTKHRCVFAFADVSGRIARRSISAPPRRKRPAVDQHKHRQEFSACIFVLILSFF